MDEPNKLALIAAYHLSRDDRNALRLLQFDNFTAAFDEIGRRLGVKPNTVKNMRDEFDAI
jgi:DNA-binding Lrp family transcriptional regulator